MNQKDNSYNRLTEGPIFASLLRFSGPVFVALLLQNLYSAVDLMIVGRFASTPDVSGVATGANLLHAITMTLTSFATGITVLVGEQIGKKDPDKAGSIIGNGIFFFACLGVLLMPAVILLAKPLAVLLKAPEEALEQTAAYVRICGIGILFIIAYNLIGAVFRGMGDSKTPMISVAIACACNIGGDLLLVKVFHMGAAGAAVATVASQGISVVLSMLMVRRKGSLPFRLRWKTLLPEKDILGRLVRLGAPLALQELLVSSSFLVIQAVLNSHGVAVSAGSGIAQKTTAFLMLIPSSFMGSMAAFVAQNMGAGRRDRAKTALFSGMRAAFAIGLFLGLVTLFYGDRMLSLFNGDKEVIAQGFSYLKSYAIDTALTPMLFCFIGYFNGTERSLFVMMQGLIGGLCIRIPVVLLMNRIPGVTPFLIGLGTPISSTVQIVMCAAYYCILKKREERNPVLPA